MRFRFCGDGDCPDWILAQINTLARLSSVKVKLLSQVVAESIASDSVLDYEKAKKLTGDAKFEEEDVKATCSALMFILRNAAKYGVSEAVLTNELQQIGFPREHGQALCRVYSERCDALTAQLCRASLRTASLVDVKTQSRDSHADVTMTYQSGTTGREYSETFSLSKAQLAVLVHDLKICSEKLKNIENEL